MTLVGYFQLRMFSEYMIMCSMSYAKKELRGMRD